MNNAVLRGVCRSLRRALCDELWDRDRLHRFLLQPDALDHDRPHRLLVVVDGPVECIQTVAVHDHINEPCLHRALPYHLESMGPQLPPSVAKCLRRLCIVISTVMTREDVYHLMHAFMVPLPAVRTVALCVRAYSGHMEPYTTDLYVQMLANGIRMSASLREVAFDQSCCQDAVAATLRLTSVEST